MFSASDILILDICSTGACNVQQETIFILLLKTHDCIRNKEMVKQYLNIAGFAHFFRPKAQGLFKDFPGPYFETSRTFLYRNLCTAKQNVCVESCVLRINMCICGLRSKCFHGFWEQRITTRKKMGEGEGIEKKCLQTNPWILKTAHLAFHA